MNFKAKAILAIFMSISTFNSSINAMKPYNLSDEFMSAQNNTTPMRCERKDDLRAKTKKILLQRSYKLCFLLYLTMIFTGEHKLTLSLLNKHLNREKTAIMAFEKIVGSRLGMEYPKEQMKSGMNNICFKKTKRNCIHYFNNELVKSLCNNFCQFEIRKHKSTNRKMQLDEITSCDIHYNQYNLHIDNKGIKQIGKIIYDTLYDAALANPNNKQIALEDIDDSLLLCFGETNNMPELNTTEFLNSIDHMPYQTSLHDNEYLNTNNMNFEPSCNMNHNHCNESLPFYNDDINSENDVLEYIPHDKSKEKESEKLKLMESASTIIMSKLYMWLNSKNNKSVNNSLKYCDFFKTGDNQLVINILANKSSNSQDGSKTSLWDDSTIDIFHEQYNNPSPQNLTFNEYFANEMKNNLQVLKLPKDTKIIIKIGDHEASYDLSYPTVDLLDQQSQYYNEYFDFMDFMDFDDTQTVYSPTNFEPNEIQSTQKFDDTESKKLQLIELASNTIITKLYIWLGNRSKYKSRYCEFFEKNDNQLLIHIFSDEISKSCVSNYLWKKYCPTDKNVSENAQFRQRLVDKIKEYINSSTIPKYTKIIIKSDDSETEYNV